MTNTEHLGTELIEALEVKTLFTIPVLGGIPVKESIATMWIVSAFIIVLSLIFTSKLSVENPTGRQLAIELIGSKLYGFFRRLVGKNGEQYVQYLLFIVLFIGVANVFPIFGFKPPSKDINVTACFAIFTIVLVQFAAIKHKGVGKWILSFKEPVSIVTPINILELGIKPFSLCMRLFGNLLGGFVIMKLIEIFVPMVIPAFASLYFDFFDGLLQAFVFAFLSALYIGEAVEDEHEHE